MMKFTLLTLLTCCISSVVMAQYQPRFKFSVGGELAIPAGTFADRSTVGLGATGQAEFSLKERWYGTITSGVLFYNGKALSGTNLKEKGLTIIPVRVGAKYFLSRGRPMVGAVSYGGTSGGLYAGAQLGVAFISNNIDYTGTAFAYTPLIIGYEFRNRADRAFDVSVKYDAYSGTGTIGNFGMRLAYIF